MNSLNKVKNDFADKFKSLNYITKNIYELKLKNEIDIKNKEINELKVKLSRYPFDLYEGEKIISIIVSSIDEDIISSIICKNIDKFSEIEERFYELYSEYKGDNYFMVNGNMIDKNKNLMENCIYNNYIVYFMRKK